MSILKKTIILLLCIYGISATNLSDNDNSFITSYHETSVASSYFKAEIENMEKSLDLLNKNFGTISEKS